jgi:S1-C subfamily serine protease
MMTGVTIEKKTGFDKTFALKVIAKGRDWDYKTPWAQAKIGSWNGSGFVIEGRKIITNAHVAANAIELEVQLAKDSEKYTAKIESIAHECDLAVLSVEDEEFWEKAQPIPVGGNVAQREEVSTHGFPMGGGGYNVGKGTVTRMERHIYVHGETEHFTYQVDAAINPGNSGGPVVRANPKTGEPEVVGVAHQGMTKGQNIGYMIPSSVLKHFLGQIEKEEIGFPGLEITTQNLENPHFRKSLGMEDKQTGVLVTDIASLSSAQGILKKDDVLLSINTIPIRNDGSVSIKDFDYATYKDIINNEHIGDSVEFEILRKGKQLTETIQLKNQEGSTYRVKPVQFDKPPTYFVLGGLLPVQPVTMNYIYATERGYKNKHKKNLSDEMVVLNRVLSYKQCTKGYKDNEFAGALITSVNDVAIHNLQDVIHATEKNIKKTHRVELKKGMKKLVIVIPNLNELDKKSALKLNSIPADRSEDLLTAQQIEDKRLEELLDASGKTIVYSRRLAPKRPTEAPKSKENIVLQEEPSVKEILDVPKRPMSAPLR